MITVHDEPGVLTIDVAGPATMVESPAVQEAVSEGVLRGVHVVRIDLRDCTTMDSTFSGTLLALKRDLELTRGTLTLVSPSLKVVELLGQMGLDGFYDVESAERATGPWHEVAPAPPQVDRLRRLIADAHDELARIPGPAADAFRAVVEELRREGDAGQRRGPGV
jgi:anti-anti-sigma regulatory factor